MMDNKLRTEMVNDAMNIMSQPYSADLGPWSLQMAIAARVEKILVDAYEKGFRTGAGESILNNTKSSE